MYYNTDMDTLSIQNDLSAYLSFVQTADAFAHIALDTPLTRTDFLSCIATAYETTRGHGYLRNYFAFLRLRKRISAILALPFPIKLFSKRLPSNAYYVHAKNKYFSKRGVYISNRQLPDFSGLLRLLIHELCHHYVSSSDFGKDVFRMTNELKRALPGVAAENSDVYALYPTEYFALCLEKTVAERLLARSPSLTKFSDCVQEEYARLQRGVAAFFAQK